MNPTALRLAAAAIVPALSLSLGGCSLSSGPGEPPAGALRVLFIGNSLTYTNNLPRTVQDLAASAGEATCYCISIAYPDYALEDHLALGEAAAELNDLEYDFVVMQQGPSALSASRENLVHNARLFGAIIQSNGARPVMLSVWPSAQRPFDFVNVRNSYREAADSINALFAPAGVAWEVAWETNSSLPLYSSDFFHPSTMGTYLAALVVFEQVYSRSPVGVQSVARVNGRNMDWEPDVVQLLQQAAAEANRRESASQQNSMGRR